ncbi:unnamed protein product [Sphagnum troendelagicum]
MCGAGRVSSAQQQVTGYVHILFLCRYSDSPSPRRASRGRSRSRTPPRRSDHFSGLSFSTKDNTVSREEALNPGNNLYVTGLSTRVTEKDLEDLFSREGKVTECRLVVDPRTRESRGFGFVTMETAEDADRCIKYLNRSTLEGRIITVEKAKRRRARTPTPGEYLGVRGSQSRGYGGDYGRDNGRDGYSARRAPRFSQHAARDGRDGRDWRDRERSPYRGHRHERSRSPCYSPYRR